MHIPLVKPGNIDVDPKALFEPGTYSSPSAHATWAALRSHGKPYLAHSPQGARTWMVTQYADASDVLRDSSAFVSGHGTLLHELGEPDIASGRMLAVMDGESHRALRDRLNYFFKPKQLGGLEDRLDAIVKESVARLLRSDDAGAVLTTFPVALASLFMDIPKEDWQLLSDLTLQSVAPALSDTNKQPLTLTHAQIFQYFINLRRTHASGSGIIAELEAQIGNRTPLNEAEILYNCYGLLLGASVTTGHALAQFLLMCAENPRTYSALRDEVRSRGQVSQRLVEEILRFSSPALHFARRAKVDITIHGVNILKDDYVVVWLASANRDETIFEKPFKFDAARHPNRHLSFGLGPHECIGAPVARRAIGKYVREIFFAVDNIQLSGDVSHVWSSFIGGLTALPLEFSTTRSTLNLL